MNKFKLMTLQVFSGLLLASTTYAEEEQLMPGSRPIEHSEWLQIQQDRANESELVQETLYVPLTDHTPIKISSSDTPEASAFKAEIYYTTHQGAYHNPIVVSAFGSIVQLEDGSIWTIADGDHYKTLNWYTGDLIVLTPNHDWFSSYLFRMSNQNTGVSVKCNMSLGPIYNGLYTHWIVGINYYTQEIYLEDGSIWQVSGFDSSIFNKWLLNDTIVIGVNDSYLSSTKPNILINVNTLTYVRAICTW